MEIRSDCDTKYTYACEILRISGEKKTCISPSKINVLFHSTNVGAIENIIEHLTMKNKFPL